MATSVCHHNFPLAAKFNSGADSDLDTICESSATISNLSFLSTETLLSEAVSGSWQISVLELSQGSDGKPLSSMACAIFDRVGLIEHFHLDIVKLKHFFEEVEKGYHEDVPYHNNAHAASVLHFMFLLMTQGGIAHTMEKCADYHLVLLASLVAAAIHDYDHVGLTNAFLEKTQHERAVKWDNEHINENHHLSAALAILVESESNFLDVLSEEHLAKFQELVSALVLGTDAADDRHLRERFEQVLQSSQPSSVCFVPTCNEDAFLALQIALKCADLGHLATEWSEHCQWVQRLELEFFAQGDRERQEGMEVSFLMDREVGGVSESQAGFFQFVALPLFSVLVDAFPAAKPMLQAVESNYSQWQQIESRKRKLCKRMTA